MKKATRINLITVALCLVVCTICQAEQVVCTICQAEQTAKYPEEWGPNLLSAEGGATVHKSSTMETAKYGAQRLIDGKIGSPYCSWKFSSKPVFAILKFLARTSVGRLAFINEQRPGEDYHVKDIAIHASDDGEHWTHVQDYMLMKSPEIQSFEPKRRFSATYLKIEVKTTHGDAKYAIMNELAAFGSQRAGAGMFRGTEEHDVMELKNGDVLTGHMLNEKLEIQTSYERLTFSKQQLASLILEGDITNIERIIVVNGDAFSGFVLDKSIKFKLSTGPEIEVRRGKIMRLGVQVRPEEKNEYARRDVMVLKNGDVFSGQVTTKQITVTTSYATVPTKTADIAMIEFIGKDRVVTKITLRNGNTMQGLLQEEDIDIDLDYGPEILIYQDKIEKIEFQK